MIIVHLPEGGKNFIPYEVIKSNIDFNDGEMSMNLSKKERDYEVTVDVCMDYTGGLVCGTAEGLRYVAQVIIPAKAYTETEKPNPSYVKDREGEGTESKTIIEREPVPFDIDNCELRLWEMEA